MDEYFGKNFRGNIFKKTRGNKMNGQLANCTRIITKNKLNLHSISFLYQKIKYRT